MPVSVSIAVIAKNEEKSIGSVLAQIAVTMRGYDPNSQIKALRKFCPNPPAAVKLW